MFPEGQGFQILPSMWGHFVPPVNVLWSDWNHIWWKYCLNNLHQAHTQIERETIQWSRRWEEKREKKS